MKFTDSRLTEIHKAVKELDESLSGEDAAYRVGVILLAATEVGQSPKALSEFTGYPRDEIKGYSKHLRENNIWNRGRTYHAGWDDEETGGIAFWLDVNVALGYVERVTE